MGRLAGPTGFNGRPTYDIAYFPFFVPIYLVLLVFPWSQFSLFSFPITVIGYLCTLARAPSLLPVEFTILNHRLRYCYQSLSDFGAEADDTPRHPPSRCPC